MHAAKCEVFSVKWPILTSELRGHTEATETLIFNKGAFMFITGLITFSGIQGITKNTAIFQGKKNHWSRNTVTSSALGFYYSWAGPALERGCSVAGTTPASLSEAVCSPSLYRSGSGIPKHSCLFTFLWLIFPWLKITCEPDETHNVHF